MPAFASDPTVFVQAGHEQADSDWSEEAVKQIEKWRARHQELQHWGNFAITWTA